MILFFGLQNVYLFVTINVNVKRDIICRCDFDWIIVEFWEKLILKQLFLIEKNYYNYGTSYESSTIKICDSDIFPNKGTRLNTSVCKCVTMHVQNKTRYKVVFISSVLSFISFSPSFPLYAPSLFPFQLSSFFSAFFVVCSRKITKSYRKRVSESWIK